MSFTRLKSVFIFTIIAALHFHNLSPAVAFNERYHVSIHSDLPPNSNPLIVLCESKDDSLGVRTLYRGDSFEWGFHINFLRSTLFYCHFTWGSKHTTFDVFNAGWDLYGHFNYEGRADGFYLNNAENYVREKDFKQIGLWP